MTNPIDAVGSPLHPVQRLEAPSESSHHERVGSDPPQNEHGTHREVSREELSEAATSLQRTINSIANVSLSFSVENDLSRMVVSVSMGSGEIIRQFPPEEFITVAKFIAQQERDVIDEDFLKGILFDDLA